MAWLVANGNVLMAGSPTEAYIDKIRLYGGTTHAVEDFNPKSLIVLSVDFIYFPCLVISLMLKKGISPS